MKLHYLGMAPLLLLPTFALAILDAELQNAKTGDQISLTGVTLPTVPLNAAPNQLETVGGALLYSDDPESATEPGILYRDQLPAGPHRVYLYHVNDTDTLSKFHVVVRNDGEATATLTLTRKSLPSPSTDYAEIGRQGVRLFYENETLPPDMILAPGATALLDEALDAVPVAKNQLLAAIYEYETNESLTVAAIMVPFVADAVELYETIGFAENDGFGRQGTFAGFTRTRETPYSYDPSIGIRHFRIAGNEVNFDPPISGIDAETSETAVLSGNYGVNYEINLTIEPTNGQSVAVVLNPRGGGYGGYFRTTWDGTTRGTLVPTGTQQVPALGGGIIDIIPASYTPRTLNIEFIPAGASSLPVNILLVPFVKTDPGWRVR